MTLLTMNNGCGIWIVSGLDKILFCDSCCSGDGEIHSSTKDMTWLVLRRFGFHTSLQLNVKWVIFTGQGFSMLSGRVKYLIFVSRLKVFGIYFISVSSSLLWQYLPKTIWSTGCRAHNNTLTLKHAIWRWLLLLNNALQIKMHKHRIINSN